MAWNSDLVKRAAHRLSQHRERADQGQEPADGLEQPGQNGGWCAPKFADHRRNGRPDVCFVTGGYVCAPMVIACWLRKIPVLIYLPDMSPGWAIRWMSKLAQRVAVSFPEAASHFGGEVPLGKGVVTGYPVRQEVIDAASNRASARRKLAQALQRPLDDGLPLMLVWGGSSGARSINQATWAMLPEVLEFGHLLHVVGSRDWPLYEERKTALVPAGVDNLAARYHPVAYLHEEMALALAAADITVSRAGASALGEYPVAKLPSILVPLTGVKQEDNAELLAKHGGAVVIADEALSSELKPTLINLLQRPDQREQMERVLNEFGETRGGAEYCTGIGEVGVGGMG